MKLDETYENYKEIILRFALTVLAPSVMNPLYLQYYIFYKIYKPHNLFNIW